MEKIKLQTLRAWEKKTDVAEQWECSSTADVMKSKLINASRN